MVMHVACLLEMLETALRSFVPVLIRVVVRSSLPVDFSKISAKKFKKGNAVGISVGLRVSGAL